MLVCLASDTHPVGVQSYVPSGYLAVDGTSIIPTDSPIIKTRRKLRELGCVLVSVTLDKHGKCVCTPVVSGPGVLDPQADKALLLELAAVAEEAVEATKGKKKGDGVREAVLSAVRKAVNREVGKKPVMEVHIQRI